MKKVRLMLTCCLLTLSVASAAGLNDDFRDPPDRTKPWCYWYWLDSDITKDGITKDLESMAKVGIKRAMIGNISMIGGGDVKMFSPKWYDLTLHAFDQANRLSIELMLFNGPGWSQSGGPWIKPAQSMRRVTWNEFSSKGGTFSQKVRPDGIDKTQDIAVLAVPRIDSVSIVGVKQDDLLRFTHTEPFTARALIVHGKANGKLYALQNGRRELVTEINANGGKEKTDFLPDAIETFSFEEVTAVEFELESNASCKVVLTSEPKVAQVIEKQMGRMHPTPSPTWESYIFPDTVEPIDISTVIKQKDIIDLTKKLKKNGVVTCKLPKGNWDVIYFGMVTTGKKNHPAPPEATGLECDKMSKQHARHHFNSMFGTLMEKMTPAQKAAFEGITIDSYEVGAQNWTDAFDKEFVKRNGYDSITLLPVMTGRVIDSAKTSDQFLWDLRRSVADMIAENYVGGMRDVAHEHGLTLWSENYGHWGFPGDFLSYGGQSDEIGGEFWTRIKNRGPIECRAASSAGHIYGKRRIYAEAFTSSLKLKHHPYVFKARGEELFCEGINHFVLHVYAHQPKDSVPGKNPWFGTAFHRNTPWFTQSQDWVKYLQRCHYMLQQGNPSADVAVYIGDFAPQMTGPANPVPEGYDHDYMGSDAILRNLDVVDGKWVVFDEHDSKRIAASYKLLAMPKVKYIRPKVLKRLDKLKAKGGKVINSVPVTAKDLQNAGIAPVVSDTSCSIRWKARQFDDGEMFFLSNFAEAGTFEATLRGSGKAPELFNPVTGQITKPARYQSVENGTRITIDVKDKSDSCFIVFRDKQSQPSVVKVQQGGKDVAPADLKLFYDDSNKLTAETAKAGTYDLTMSDGTRRSLSVKKPSDTLAIKGPWQTTKTFQQGFSIQQETTFTVPAGFGKDQRVYLDLGEVEVMAKVTLNGKTYDTLWMPPFTLDVTDAVKGGDNKLQVVVTSTTTGNPTLSSTVQLKTATQKLAAMGLAAEKPNVLLIAVDDLNDWIGCMGGHPQAKTPNIDRLAERGVLFTNTQCQSPVCNPSRASLMTSLYPSTSGIYFLNPDLEQSPVASESKLMPQRFVDEGYYVTAAGKLFHGKQNKKYIPDYAGSFGGFGPMPKNKISSFPGHFLWDWGVYPQRDEQMPDHKIASWAQKQLAVKRDRPLWMGVGFFRPHVPQYAPQKWFDMYPLDTLELPRTMTDDLKDISRYGIDITRLEHVAPTHEWVLKNNEWKPLVQSYLACVSFVDAQVGRVIDALDSSEYADNTYIVLFSDHGFHLGEKQRYAKRSLWEDGTRTPMIIVGPGIAKGKVCNKPTQLLDIYPTILELTGHKADSSHEGNSLVPLLKDPEADWPHMARTSFGPGNYAIVSQRYRYIHYNDGSEELYDHAKDPHEWNNIATDQEYAQIIKQHRLHLPQKRYEILGKDSTGHQSYWATEKNRK